MGDRHSLHRSERDNNTWRPKTAWRRYQRADATAEIGARVMAQISCIFSSLLSFLPPRHLILSGLCRLAGCRQAVGNIPWMTGAINGSGVYRDWQNLGDMHGGYRIGLPEPPVGSSRLHHRGVRQCAPSKQRWRNCPSNGISLFGTHATSGLHERYSITKY